MSLFHKGLIAGLLMAVAACDSPQHTAKSGAGFRNPDIVIAGTTRFDAERFAGEWRSISCLGICPERQSFVMNGVPSEAEGDYARLVGNALIKYSIEAPGVLRSIYGDDRLVVMWVDTGFRTAVIGASDGEWATIIDRSRPSPDRIKAAREILDFNGWDTSKLRNI